MAIIDKIRTVLLEQGIEFQETGRSLITACIICGKSKHLYLFLETGYGKCMRCNALINPTSFIAQVKHCTYLEAQTILAAESDFQHTSDAKLPDLATKVVRPGADINMSVFILPFSFYELKDGEYDEAWQYLQRRGIHSTIAKQYHLMYSPEMQRIIIPIFYENQCVGWQGRDITGTAQLPYIFPSGFRRAQVLMGISQINPAIEHLILSEGAFDWLKVAILGNAVCSMGKNVSINQVKLIQSLPYIKRIYIALDPDAWDSFDKLKSMFDNKEVWLMTPPDNKKDFGECTDAEINYAFHNAKRYNKKSFISGKILNKGRL